MLCNRCLVLLLVLGLCLPALALADQASVREDKQADENARSQTTEASVKTVDALSRAWLAHTALQHSLVGLEIMELPAGRVLFSLNGSRRFVPASVAKLITTACALDTLGADFRYQTRLIARGPIKKDRLLGDLIIVPSQDPTLDTQDLRELFAALSERKVKRIEGKLKLRTVPGGFDQFCPGWLAEDWGQDWMPVSSNFVLDHNIAPGRDPGRGWPVTTRSLADEQSALARSLLSSNLAPAWVSFDPGTKSATVYRSPFPSMSASGGAVVANPDEYNLAAATTILRSMGLQVESRSLARSESDDEPLSEIVSKPLTEIIKTTLHESDNLYAQQLLRTIGAVSRSARAGEEVPLEESGLSRLRDWLANIGVHPSEVVLFDGCGLSRKNCVTPHALNMVLKHMAGPNLDGAYLGLLRQDGNPNSQHSSFRFKTGAMDCVRCVTGIARTAAGDGLAVSVMVNGHTASIRDLRAVISSLTSRLELLPSLGTSVSKSQVEPKTTSGRLRATAKPAKRRTTRSTTPRSKQLPAPIRGKRARTAAKS